MDGPVFADSHWGVIAGKYDEYFFRQPDTNMDPAHILESQAALDFVRQADPDAVGPVEEGKYYTGEINGKNVSRVYYQNPEIHPQNVFSHDTAADVIEFFYNTLGTPDGYDYIAPSNQVWFVKQLLNLLGLVGMLLFLFPFACWIMDAVPLTVDSLLLHSAQRQRAAARTRADHSQEQGRFLGFLRSQCAAAGGAGYAGHA